MAERAAGRRDHSQVAGAYPVYEFDVTRWVREGSNTLALRVPAADPRTSLSLGWNDWNPAPPDNNMGPWRGVDIVQKGSVEIRFPHAISTLTLPKLARAALTVKADVRNLDALAHEVRITGVAAGVPLARTLHLAAGETQSVEFSPASDPRLELKEPRVWWPVGMGAHPLYQLKLAATVNGAISDEVSVDFGIRSVSSHTDSAGPHPVRYQRQKPVLIRGAGWAPDMFLRDDPRRMETEFSYIANLGLNTIRNEGMLETTHFYDLADRNGIMILAGWECCDKWEAAAGTGGEPWNAADEKGCRRFNGERGAFASRPSVRDRILDRQRQCATGGHREDVR